MPSNVSITITAEVVDLQTKLAVARAEFQATQATLKSLASQAAASAEAISDEMKASLTVAAEASLKAKAEVSALNAKIKEASGTSSAFSSSLGTVTSGLGSLGIAVSGAAVLAFAKSVEEGAAQLQHESEVLQLSVTALQDFHNVAINYWHIGQTFD